MLLIVGLGNPGSKYAKNRHNIGFMAVDEIAAMHHFPAWREKFNSEICQGSLDGENTVLMKPLTFMNESGQAVRKACDFFKIPSDNVFVFHDELDLVPGKLRVKTGGGHAGHNGLRSIDAHIGKDYHRVRLGIGHPGDKTKVHKYVLGDFAKADADWLSEMLGAIAKAAPLLVRGEMASFQNKVHAAQQQAKPAAAKVAPSSGTAPIEPKPASKPAAAGPFAGLKKLLSFSGKD